MPSAPRPARLAFGALSAQERGAEVEPLERRSRSAGRVPVYSAGGFASLWATIPAASHHSSSGHSIFEAMAQDAAAFVEADRVVRTLGLDAERVALTAEQVEAHGLPTVPPKPSDSRSKLWEGDTCQLEALAPDTLAEIVTAAIENQLDLGVYREQLRAEVADRAELLGLPAGGGE